MSRRIIEIEHSVYNRPAASIAAAFASVAVFQIYEKSYLFQSTIQADVNKFQNCYLLSLCLIITGVSGLLIKDFNSILWFEIKTALSVILVAFGILLLIQSQTFHNIQNSLQQKQKESEEKSEEKSSDETSRIHLSNESGKTIQSLMNVSRTIVFLAGVVSLMMVITIIVMIEDPKVPGNRTSTNVPPVLRTSNANAFHQMRSNAIQQYMGQNPQFMEQNIQNVYR